MSTPFSWNKYPTSWADSGRSKLTSCSSHTHRADKYSWTCCRYGCTTIQSPTCTKISVTSNSPQTSPTLSSSTSAWSRTSRGSSARWLSNLKTCQWRRCVSAFSPHRTRSGSRCSRRGTMWQSQGIYSQTIRSSSRCQRLSRRRSSRWWLSVRSSVRCLARRR